MNDLRLHAGLFLSGHYIFSVLNVILNIMNCDWLLYMSVRHPVLKRSINSAKISRPSALSLKIWLLFVPRSILGAELCEHGWGLKVGSGLKELKDINV